MSDQIPPVQRKRLTEVAAYSLAIGTAVALPMCWRLRYLYEAFGGRDIVAYPLSVWLPIALFASLATYIAALTNLAPKRVFLGSSVLLFCMASMLAVVHYVFGDIGRDATDTLAPFVVQHVALGPMLLVARMRRFRLVSAVAGVRPPEATNWQFPIADLLLLTAGLAVCLTMILKFDYQWFGQNGPYGRFTWQFGLCLSFSSMAVIWATLGENWRRWALLAVALAPLGGLPAWYVNSTLYFEFYWYGVVTAAHAAFLGIALGVLRVQRFRLAQLPRPASAEPTEPAQARQRTTGV